MGWSRYPRRFIVHTGGRRRRRLRIGRSDLFAGLCLLVMLAVALASSSWFRTSSPRLQFAAPEGTDPLDDEVIRPMPRRVLNEGDAYYRNCDAARAAGAAPIARGMPGYRDALDRDNDGWACEPYPR